MAVRWSRIPGRGGREASAANPPISVGPWGRLAQRTNRGSAGHRGVPLANTDVIPVKFPRMAHRLRDLGPQHHAAVRMRIEGVPSDEICERLGIERRTLYLWFVDPLVKAELTRQLARVDELFA